MESSGILLSPSVSTSIMLGGCGGECVGLALSCLISNGRLPGGSVCQAPEPPVFPQVTYGQSGPIPLAGPKQRPEQARNPGPPSLPLALPQGMPCPLPAAKTRHGTVTPLPGPRQQLSATTSGHPTNQSLEMVCGTQCIVDGNKKRNGQKNISIKK